MSKRFGRQQKRKLKHQMEQQERELTLKDRRIGELNGTTRKAEEVLSVIRKINPHFPALEEVSELSKDMQSIALDRQSSPTMYCNQYNPSPFLTRHIPSIT